MAQKISEDYGILRIIPKEGEVMYAFVDFLYLSTTYAITSSQIA